MTFTEIFHKHGKIMTITTRYCDSKFKQFLMFRIYFLKVFGWNIVNIYCQLSAEHTVHGYILLYLSVPSIFLFLLTPAISLLLVVMEIDSHDKCKQWWWYCMKWFFFFKCHTQFSPRLLWRQAYYHTKTKQQRYQGACALKQMQ